MTRSLNKVIAIFNRPAYDRAYEGLWSLVVSSEIEGK